MALSTTWLEYKDMAQDPLGSREPVSASCNRRPVHQGSWAGAMGDTQFMPSNVAAYGVDADKNGKLDLWDSEEDI
jgi:hypothetical protein